MNFYKILEVALIRKVFTKNFLNSHKDEITEMCVFIEEEEAGKRERRVWEESFAKRIKRLMESLKNKRELFLPPISAFLFIHSFRSKQVLLSTVGYNNA